MDIQLIYYEYGLTSVIYNSLQLWFNKVEIRTVLMMVTTDNFISGFVLLQDFVLFDKNQKIQKNYKWKTKTNSYNKYKQVKQLYTIIPGTGIVYITAIYKLVHHHPHFKTFKKIPFVLLTIQYKVNNLTPSW